MKALFAVVTLLALLTVGPVITATGQTSVQTGSDAACEASACIQPRQHATNLEEL